MSESKGKTKKQFEHIGGKTFRAMTGLENANRARVEQGEILPSGFVHEEQLERWLAQRDVMIVFEEVREVDDGSETR